MIPLKSNQSSSNQLFLNKEEVKFWENLRDWKWRVNNLYYIKNKNGKKVKFKVNWAQQIILSNFWFFSIILKARQLGITTFYTILYLDQVLFNSNKAAAIIAHTDIDTKRIFEKVKFAWDSLPEELKESLGHPKTESVGEMAFPNGSKIFVARSTRGGSLQFLHISEFAKICAKYPEKAREIVTGAINSVEQGNFVSIESTAEGKEGFFYDFCNEAQRAELEKRKLSEMEFKFFFFPWWKEVTYRTKGEFNITKDYENYFNTLEKIHNIILDDEQKRWYIIKKKTQGEDMFREYPSCVIGDTLVQSKNGIVPIEHAVVDGKIILAKYNKGIRPVFKIKTQKGYEVICTDDHPIKTNNGFIKVKNISIGDTVMLGIPKLNTQQQIVEYPLIGFAKASVEITPDFGRFMGYFMGDGSLYKDCFSICCTAEDTDIVKDVSELCEKFIGTPNIRTVGDKKGGTEIRVSNIKLKDHFYGLGIIRQNGSSAFKRKVNVPGFIFKSPPIVVKEFLRGLFEADGFAHRTGNGVKFFSKYEKFIRDVQLLLLSFGITSIVTTHDKVSGLYKYTGFELVLGTAESIKFKQQIGFVSMRKNNRLREPCILHKNSKPIIFEDKILSIEANGEKQVWDITTPNHEFSAGGIIVHNCPEEAFMASIEGSFYAEQMKQVYSDQRIRNVPWDSRYTVDTWWDLGMNDMNVILFTQAVGNEIRIIDEYHNHGEGLAHYINILTERGYTYGSHTFPHDVEVRSLDATGKSRRETLHDLGIRNIRTIERSKDIQDDIEAVRKIFSRFYFDENKTAKVVEALNAYRKEWDDKLGVFKNSPRHDKHSHIADTFRLLARGWKQYLIEGKDKVDIVNFF